MVLEPDAGLVQDPPQLAPADRRHDLGPDHVGPELGQAPGRERLTPIGRSGEGRLHDLGPLVEIDPAWSAPAPPRVQGREPPRVEVVDERRDMGRAGSEHRRDGADALALVAREQEHRPVTYDRVPAPARLLEEVSRLLVGQLTDEELGPAGHRHLLCFGSPDKGRWECDYLPDIMNQGTRNHVCRGGSRRDQRPLSGHSLPLAPGREMTSGLVIQQSILHTKRSTA